MTIIGRVLDSRIVKALPDVDVHGWIIARVGWNFQPDWDRSLWQPWHGRWWIWVGPYLIGKLSDW